MVIPETNNPANFADSVIQFERTNSFRSKVSECTREELIDLASHLLTKMEEIRGFTENLNGELEHMLGYHEPLTIR